jgi:Protein of unknown function (DUF2442).
MSRIEKVIPKEKHCIEIIFENKSSVILNLESKLQTVRFKALTDEALFRRVTTDGNYIRWDKKVEISVEEIFQLVKK